MQSSSLRQGIRGLHVNDSKVHFSRISTDLGKHYPTWGVSEESCFNFPSRWLFPVCTFVFHFVFGCFSLLVDSLAMSPAPIFAILNSVLH